MNKDFRDIMIEGNRASQHYQETSLGDHSNDLHPTPR